MTDVNNLGIEKLESHSEEVQNQLHNILEKIVHTYFTLCDESTFHIHSSLVNQYSRDYNYLIRRMSDAQILLQHYEDFLVNFHIPDVKVRRQLILDFKQMFGCLMHGVFPDLFKGYSCVEMGFCERLERLSQKFANFDP